VKCTKVKKTKSKFFTKAAIIPTPAVLTAKLKNIKNNKGFKKHKK